MTDKTKNFLINCPIVLFVFLLCLIIGAKTTIIRTFGTVATGAIAAAMQSPVAGTAPKTVYLLVAASFFYALIPFVPLMIIFFWKTKHDKAVRILTVFISILLFVWSLYPCIKDVCLMVCNYDRPNELLRNYYVPPENVKLSFPEKKRNLIFIIAESMETTFFPKNYGGALNDNIIPELYDLARDNVCFSVDGNCLGMKPTRDHWTSAAIVAQTSGIPFIVPPDKRGSSPKRKSLPGVTSMFDILHDNGYKQMFICGSDIRFANRDIYLKTHNVDFVYDLNTAREERFISVDYHDGWWGMEDKKMFEYAKKKLTDISNSSSPFVCVILTVDTHSPEGNYREDCCKHQFNENYLNVYACTSRQISAFMEWLKTRPFYANTTVVITGDHPTMCQGSVMRLVPKRYERHIYNCFINSPVKPKKEKNRNFTMYDLFPTVLSSLGCRIHGKRLAFGTDMFSDRPTLYEELGEELFWKKFGTEKPNDIIPWNKFSAGNSRDYDRLFLRNR
ncbi:MAG: LTA synthase family protein [Synergistes sp.]|nr:LTA synthase family protein [Synergistes sp.]